MDNIILIGMIKKQLYFNNIYEDINTAAFLSFLSILEGILKEYSLS